MSDVPLTSDSYMFHTLQRHREILNVSVLIYLNNTQIATVILIFHMF